MDLCVILQIYFAMASAHLGTAKDHVKISEGGQYLQGQCDKIKEKNPKPEEPKKEEPPQKTAVGKSKVE